MPRIWLSQDSSPNAFVFGRTVASSELVVTQALLQRLNQEEIRAVLAHEIGHLRHRDVVIVTLMSAIPLIAYVIARFGSRSFLPSGFVMIRRHSPSPSMVRVGPMWMRSSMVSPRRAWWSHAMISGVGSGPQTRS